ncbi:MAG: hypothetical protein QG670_2888 [Thermoproteota archaeon]|nr:hypothetical protein [Thermoproteota archaeon]
MAAPKEIVDLVERFESNLASYKSGHYNETQVRREFVDPFFKTLGWDIDNEQGFAEAYKDVIHEDAIKVGATTKAPDYSFRIGGQRKFFLEAKKPSVDIKEGIHSAFQLRRYAWSAKTLHLSILTDFEEFSVYDCRVKPDKMDKASTARVLYLTYKDYLTRWDEIAGIFSKNAVLKGSFDKYAADKKNKRGTTEVDAAFLEEIAGWREILARNIALRNPDLSTKDLNYAVQAIVNRIVFLRICEDRGIERLMKLQDLLNGERVYPRLCEIFRRADERYNSGIFHFEKEAGRESPDTLTLSLNIDDKPLKEIIKRLYYPDSPYEFSVLPAEILGQVYEQFLGKVIRLTEGHRAVVEDKPEVKKAGGVKYTPVYIVENIVGSTLGHILKGKTLLEVVLISVLDPACGSGSFLIVAYQYLLDWHREWYVQNLVPLLQNGLKPSSPEIRRMLPSAPNETGKKGRKKEPELPVYQGRGGEWRLTTAERKRILLNNIYGVDIDRQAVEVTKLSLLLKVLEGENDETISKQLKLFQERALPDLSNNIKCGNSLIGWDILNDNPGMGQEEIDRINPFDWEKEFPEIFQRGGFNLIIGNPPYGAEFSQDLRHFLSRKYNLPVPITDSFVLFILKSFQLLRSGGLQSFIVPSPWLYMSSYVDFRKSILSNYKLKDIILFRQPVFSKVTVETCIETIEKKVDSENSIKFLEITEESTSLMGKTYYLDQSSVLKEPESNLCQIGDKISRDLFSSIENKAKKLSDLTHIVCGLTPYRKGKGKPHQTQEIVDNKSFDADHKVGGTYRQYLMGRDFHRYVWQIEKERWINYGDWLAEPRYAAPFNDAIKIVIRQTADSIIAQLDDNQYISLKNVHNLRINFEELNYHYLLGLLNSKLISWWYQQLIPEKGRVFAEVKVVNLKKIPILTIDFSNPAEVARHDRMVSLVDQMLSLHKQHKEARTPHEQTGLQRQIEATDRQIDALVYELYGLNDEEIRIVEGT